MTQSPKKYVSTFTSSMTNRGVEAKEVEIASTQLETDASASTHYQESSDVELRSQASGDTGSYLQVVVQKHKKKDPTSVATQTSCRMPVASSPIKAAQNGAGDTQLYLLQQPMLLAYPNAQQKQERKKLSTVKEESVKRSFWSKFKEESNESSPDKIDLYYFEKTTGDFLSTTDGTFTYSERYAVQISRVQNRIAAEIFAVPQLIAGIPVAIFLNLERSVFILLRGFLVGSVQICSDYVLKPVLAVSFNAVIQPPLVFIANVGRALRDAARPIAGMLGDFMEPVVKVVSAVRLINVEKCKCPRSHNV